MNPRDHEAALDHAVTQVQQVVKAPGVDFRPVAEAIVDGYLSYIWGKGYKITERGHGQS